MSNTPKKINNSIKVNKKELNILLDNLVYNSLNNGNIHFLLTINFKENIKKKKELNIKIDELFEYIKQIGLISWFHISSEIHKEKKVLKIKKTKLKKQIQEFTNTKTDSEDTEKDLNTEETKSKKNTYHLHAILAIKSLIGYNDKIESNILYFLRNEFELDTNVELLYDFINIKRSWSYLNKDINEFEDNNTNILYIEENQKFIFEPIYEKSFFNTKSFKENLNNFSQNELEIIKSIKGRMLEQNKMDKNYKKIDYNSIVFLLEYYLQLNEIYIYKQNLYTKINDSIMSCKDDGDVINIIKNFEIIMLYFIYKLKIHFDNFDISNFIAKYITNNEEKIKKEFISFSRRKIILSSNWIEFTDGIYSKKENTFINKKIFEKKYKQNLEEILFKKKILTKKYFNKTYHHLSNPQFWIEGVCTALDVNLTENNMLKKILYGEKRNNKNLDKYISLILNLGYIINFEEEDIEKQGTLYIHGPSNTGKTLFIENLMINWFGKDNIGFVSTNNNFEYQNIEGKELILFTEFNIKKTNIQEFKKITANELMLTENKGKDAKLKEMLPMLITSNYGLENEEEAVLNRLNIIHFSKQQENLINKIKEKIKEEEPNIIVYINRVYHNYKKSKSKLSSLKLLDKY